LNVIAKMRVNQYGGVYWNQLTQKLVKSSVENNFGRFNMTSQVLDEGLDGISILIYGGGKMYNKDL
jgi:hypothetical protein